MITLIPVSEPTCEGCIYEYSCEAPCDDSGNKACGSKGSKQFYIYKDAINSFSGSNRFLSNFWKCQVLFDGIIYPSSEHAYVAAKTLDWALREEIRLCPTAGKVKRLGRKLVIRDDWETVKLDIMYAIVKDKFTRSLALATKLLATAQLELVEGNTWGDTVWGVCNGVGENHLGKILMRVREELAQI